MHSSILEEKQQAGGFHESFVAVANLDAEVANSSVKTLFVSLNGFKCFSDKDSQLANEISVSSKMNPLNQHFSKNYPIIHRAHWNFHLTHSSE